MKSKVKPPEVLSKTIENFLKGVQPSEAEGNKFSGRGWHERSGDQAYMHKYHNGYTPVMFKTAQDPISLQSSRVRDSAEPFESTPFARIDRLVKLAAKMFIRGFPTRDIEQTIVESAGGAVLSRNQQVGRGLGRVFLKERDRDLAHPLLIVSNGTGGPTWGCCIFHKMRNLDE